MGEAKRRRSFEDRAKALSKSISRSRFALFTMGTREARAAYMAEELSWWASNDERLLGMVARDITDNDYLWIILARDKIGCFRCAALETCIKSQDFAERKLRAEIAKLVQSGRIEEFGEQGDETNSPLDPFEIPIGLDHDKLHPYYKVLLDEPGRAPARKVISELTLWLAPKDPHFVTEFQTNGFDQRLWEMFLWAAFKEFSLNVEQLEAPDFLCQGPGIDFTVEATTVGPSLGGVLKDHPNPQTPEELDKFLRDYMPMKFGGALTAKLNKKNAANLRYWERDESKGKPFAIAVADFHKPADDRDPGSMVYTQSALWQYLYGSRVSWHFEADQLIIEEHSLDSHEFNGKEVPSGFFDLPDAEHVSAVFFSNAGTIAKFDRMGVCAGFAAEDYGYHRIGFKYNSDPNAIVGEPFAVDVCDDSYIEYWTQEIQVFHNPNAKFPLDFSVLPGATHHFYEKGSLRSFSPEDAVLSSITILTKYTD